METLAHIIDATLKELFEKGVNGTEDGAVEFLAEADIEIYPKSQQPLRPDMDIAIVRIQCIDALWYVYLWRWTHEQWEAYHAVEACMDCKRTSEDVHLHEVAGMRLCSDCIAPPAPTPETIDQYIDFNAVIAYEASLPENQ